MTVFFQLSGQRAAPGGLAGEGKHLRQLRPGGFDKTWPVHRRVGHGLLRIEQIAVFDKQQAVHQQRRNGGKGRVKLLRVFELVQRLVPAIGDRQPGLGLFLVRHEKPMPDVTQQFRGKTGLARNHIIALEQARQEFIHG